MSFTRRPDWLDGVRRMPIDSDALLRRADENRAKAQQQVFDHAYAEAAIENKMHDAVARWRTPFPDDYIEMAKRIGDLLCIGVEIELMKRRQP